MLSFRLGPPLPPPPPPNPGYLFLPSRQTRKIPRTPGRTFYRSFDFLIFVRAFRFFTHSLVPLAYYFLAPYKLSGLDAPLYVCWSIERLYGYTSFAASFLLCMITCNVLFLSRFGLKCTFFFLSCHR